MAAIQVEASRQIAASPERVRDCVADFTVHRPQWLPPNYSDLVVEQGGVGAGTVVRYRLKVGPRERLYRMQIAEPAPGTVLTESDSASSMVFTWTFAADGAGCRVTIAARWSGAGGVGGLFERLFAPGGVRRLFTDELERLDRYVTGSAGQAAT